MKKVKLGHTGTDVSAIDLCVAPVIVMEHRGPISDDDLKREVGGPTPLVPTIARSCDAVGSDLARLNDARV